MCVQVTQAVANARRMAANREKMGGPEGACANRPSHPYAVRAPPDTAVACVGIRSSVWQ